MRHAPGIGRGIQARSHESDHLRRPGPRRIDLRRVHHICISRMTQHPRSTSTDSSSDGERREREHAQICGIKNHEPRDVASDIHEGSSEPQQFIDGHVQLDLVVLVLVVVHERRRRLHNGLLYRRFVLNNVVVQISLQISDLPPHAHVVRER